MGVEMASLGNYVVKAELSLDQTPQMPETQTLQQLDHALVVKVILCGVCMWNDGLVQSQLRTNVCGGKKRLEGNFTRVVSELLVRFL